MRKIIFSHPKYTLARTDGKFTFMSRPGKCDILETFIFTTNDERTTLCLNAKAGEPVELSAGEVEIILQDGNRYLQKRKKRKKR